MEDKIKELLLNAQSGDEEAFNEVYQRYYQSTYLKAYQLFRNDADAKDATQEAFVEVSRSLPNLRDITSFYSWLMMIVTSKSYTIMRKRKYNFVDIQEQERSDIFKEDRIYMNPRKVSQNDDERAILLNIIESLTAKQAEIVKLIYFEELKQAEIAERLNLPLGTVKTRSVKAKKELKEKIEAFEKKENYRLQFHVDLIIPTTLLAISYPQLFLTSIKEISQQTYQFLSQQGVMVVCSTSMVTLAVSGATFVYDDIQASKEVQVQPVTTQPLPQNTFNTLSYEEDQIQSHRDAYYACLNFANDEETMKQYTSEEYEALKPIYERMKQSNSMYYQALVSQGWNTLFETHAYK